VRTADVDDRVPGLSSEVAGEASASTSMASCSRPTKTVLELAGALPACSDDGVNLMPRHFARTPGFAVTQRSSHLSSDVADPHTAARGRNDVSHAGDGV